MAVSRNIPRRSKNRYRRSPRASFMYRHPLAGRSRLRTSLNSQRTSVDRRCSGALPARGGTLAYATLVSRVACGNSNQPSCSTSSGAPGIRWGAWDIILCTTPGGCAIKAGRCVHCEGAKKRRETILRAATACVLAADIWNSKLPRQRLKANSTSRAATRSMTSVT